jgi:Fe2+ or Zn2+ uptake regulation protein
MALEPLPSEAASGPDIFEPLCAVFRRSLKREGLKYTPERARVLDVIVRGPWQDRGGLFQVDALLDLLRREERTARGAGRDGPERGGPERGGAIRVSKATVYRTLRHMLDAGIVQRVSLGDAPPGAGDDESSSASDAGHYQLVYGRRSNDLIVRTDTHGVEVIAPSDAPELVALRERLCRERGLVALGHRFHVFASARED